MTLYMLACVKLGVKLKVPVPLPLLTKVALVGRFTALIVGNVPSGSVAESLKFSVKPSVTDFAPIAASTGR